MNRRNVSFRLIAALLAAVGVVQACRGAARPAPIPTPLLAPTPTAPPIPTRIPSPTPLPSATPTITPSRTPTVTPSATATTTPTSTFTPPPTYTPVPTATRPPTLSPTPTSTLLPGQLTLTPSGGRSPKPQPGELNKLNKVANPNFTTGKYTFTAPDGRSIPNVPSEWLAWADTTYGPWPNYDEELDPKHHFPADWVSWHIWSIGANFRAGLYQKFTDLQPGAVYRANCWMFAYAGEDIKRIPATGFIKLRLGIDPLAGDSPNAPSIIWGIENANMIGSEANVLEDIYGPWDLFAPYTVIFTAPSARATLWIEGKTDFAYPMNSFWVDSCEMYAIGWASDFGMPMP